MFGWSKFSPWLRSRHRLLARPLVPLDFGAGYLLQSEVRRAVLVVLRPLGWFSLAITYAVDASVAAATDDCKLLVASKRVGLGGHGHFMRRC